MIKVENLCSKIREKVVLENLNFNSDADLTFIFGRNGSGKSTILKSFVNYPNYTWSGKIIINLPDLPVINVLENSYTDLISKGILFTFQDPVEVKGLSNFEFLYQIFKKRIAINKAEDITREDFNFLLSKISKDLGIEEELYSRPDVNYGFSGGERKKNLLLQIFIFKPIVLLLDEIDTGVDRKYLSDFLIPKLEEFILGNGTKTFLVTHNLWIASQFQKLSKKFLVLKEGKSITEILEKDVEKIEKFW